MIRFNKSALVLATLTLMSLSLSADEAINRVIKVTTFADEDGENLENCSLREAITTASKGQAYGGCPVGEVLATRATIIQLDAGEYQLKSELQPTRNVVIQGKDSIDFQKRSVLTNKYPALTEIQTRIRAVANNRIINSTTFGQPDIVLNNIELHDGVSTGRGGAIWAGGMLTLNNVSIFNARAKEGAAVYLDGDRSSLIANRGRIEGNQAERGSVLAMSCTEGLSDSQHTVNIVAMSIVKNGSANSQSTLDYCGLAVSKLEANSIGLNQADPSRGSIIQFSSKTAYGDVLLNSQNALLRLLSNTIVQNSAYTTLLYNTAGKKEIEFNVLAFNAVDGKSCRFVGNHEEVKNAQLQTRANGVLLNAGQDECELIAEKKEDIAKDNIALDQYNFNQLFSPLSQKKPDEYTAYMPMYFTKTDVSNHPLIDTKFDTGCSPFDQRGIQRIGVKNPSGKEDKANTCDIGATEVLRLTTVNFSGSNPSVVDLIQRYQMLHDDVEQKLKQPDVKPELLPYYHSLIEEYSHLIKFTEEKQKYRTIFFDPFQVNLPDETVSSDGVREIKYLNADLYDVSVKALGVGPLNNENTFEGQFDPNLKCEWDKDLKQILMYRTDDRLTPSDFSEFCEYTLTMKNSSPVKSSSAHIIATFRNIEPIAMPVSYTVSPGDSEWVELKLLENTHDKGDGDVSQLKSKPNKLGYYTDAKGDDFAIRFTQLRDAVQIKSERSGPCPDNVKLTCHGGKIQAKLKNTFDPFNYKLKYVVYDADGLVSKENLIEIKNTGSSTGSTSGGGSVGVFSILTLFSLGYWRLRSKHKT